MNINNRIHSFKKDNFNIIKVIFFILISLLFYKSSILVIFYYWFDPESYYTQGPFILLVFIWLLIIRLQKQSGYTNNRISISGLMLNVFSIALYLFGKWNYIDTFQIFSLYFFIVGNSLFFLGKNFVLKNFDIYLYLLLAIPLPGVIIDRLTFDLKIFSSYISELILTFFYPSILRTGNILNINDFNITVTPACSGLGNIFAMFSIFWLMAMLQTGKFRVVLNYLISLPAAIISNILRIVVVSVLVAEGYGKFALEEWHDEIGIIIFILVIVVFSLFNEFSINDLKIKKITLKSDFINSKLISSYILIMAFLTIISFFIPERNATGNQNTILIKNQIPVKIAKWYSNDEKLEENYFDILDTEDLLMRTYSSEINHSTENVYLFLVHSKENRFSFHRPEVCIEGEGYNLVENDKRNIVINNNIVSVHRMLFSMEGRGLLVYYWYRTGNKNYFNYLKFKLFFYLDNDCSGGTLIRLSKVVDLKDIATDEKILDQFISEALPEILKYL